MLRDVTVARVDPENFAVAGIASDGQFFGRCAEEIGRISTVPPSAQAPTCPTESQARNQFQHSADETSSVQSPRLHAH